jgi:aspartate/methionine/tyrosine aminotransferase
MPSLAARTGAIAPFYVMEVAKAAAELEAQGRSVIHMSIGEPDFTAPPAVQAAAADAIARGATQYTPALGLPALRAAIAGWYASFYGIEVDPQRVIVTAGASAALLLAFAALLEREAEVLMPDPSYPCNRHFAAAFDGRARLVPCGPETRFQLTPAMVRAHWTAATRGVLLASPSNPTGTSIPTATLRELLATVRERAGFVVVDEIYQGLSYDGAPTTALALDDEAIVLNSFSKYFNMTGWRLGWLVAPASMVAALERLAQNLYICPSAVAQHAALACFAPESIAIYEERRAEFKRRRDYLLAELPGLGLRVPVAPGWCVLHLCGRERAHRRQLGVHLPPAARHRCVPGAGARFRHRRAAALGADFVRDQPRTVARGGRADAGVPQARSGVRGSLGLVGLDRLSGRRRGGGRRRRRWHRTAQRGIDAAGGGQRDPVLLGHDFLRITAIVGQVASADVQLQAALDRAADLDQFLENGRADLNVGDRIERSMVAAMRDEASAVHVRHHLHQALGASRTLGKRVEGGLDRHHRQDQLRVQLQIDRTAVGRGNQVAHGLVGHAIAAGQILGDVILFARRQCVRCGGIADGQRRRLGDRSCLLRRRFRFGRLHRRPDRRQLLGQLIPQRRVADRRGADRERSHPDRH